MGKGSHPRPFTDRKQFEDNWDEIVWGPKMPPKKEFEVNIKVEKIEKGKPSND